MTKARKKLFRAAMIADGESVLAAPGAILVEHGRILAAGSPQEIGSAIDAEIVERSDGLIIPALVNAHSHLDLTHLGILPFTGDFVSWVDTVRAGRAATGDEIAGSVRRGIDLSRAGGTAMVGDIAGAGSLIPAQELRRAGLAGVSYVEFFGIGARQKPAADRLLGLVEDQPGEQDGVRLGVQPHAPYSCGLDVYRAAARCGRPVSTHLAETLEEVRFVHTADGPLAELLRRIGVWDDSIHGADCHPVDHLAEILKTRPILAAHLNYLEDRHVELLAQWRTSVAYCPRASAYFGHPHADNPPHRYREMIEAGVNVALGTDGLPCLDTPDRICVLDEMRFLYQRDGTDPRRLLRMGTTAGAMALGFDPSLVTLDEGPTVGILSIRIDPDSATDPLRQAMSNAEAPVWESGPWSGAAV